MATALKMPRLGQDMTEGTIVTWAKRVGDQVRAGETLVHIETDKAVVEYESPVSGHLRAILVAEGDTVPVGTRIAWITDAADDPLPSGADPGQAPAGATAPPPSVSASTSRRSPRPALAAGSRTRTWNAPPQPRSPAMTTGRSAVAPLTPAGWNRASAAAGKGS